jgi:HEAT repeat protein
MDSGKEEFRAPAVSAFCSTGSENDIGPKLILLLSDRNEGVRINACSSLAGMGKKELLPVLVSALGDASAAVRFNAAQGLLWLGHAAREAGPALEKCLNDQDEYVRAAAAMALESIRGGEPPK